MTSKTEIRNQIKLLRVQMAKLEESMERREDKLMSLLLILEPFLNALSPEMHKQILSILDKEVI